MLYLVLWTAIPAHGVRPPRRSASPHLLLGTPNYHLCTRLDRTCVAVFISFSKKLWKAFSGVAKKTEAWPALGLLRMEDAF